MIPQIGLRSLAVLTVTVLAVSMLAGMVSLSPTASAANIEVTVVAKETGCPAGKDFCFEPAEIAAEVGDTVTITLVNDANNTASHDLKIDEFGVMTDLIGPGEQDTITFVVDKAGNFAYYCTVPGHRQLGMEGSLVVAGETPAGPDITFMIGVTAGVLLAIGVVAFIIISARRKK
jgi:nitrite reductase (NO-forming)